MKREHENELVGTIVRGMYLRDGNTPRGSCIVWDESTGNVRVAADNQADPDTVIEYSGDEKASAHTIWVFVTQNFTYCPNCGGFSFQGEVCYDCRHKTDSESITTTTLTARPMPE